MEYDADKNKTSVIMDNSTFVSRQGKEGLRLKPIFHQNAKLLALGTFASAYTKDSTFALPNAKNTNMLVSRWVTHIFRVLPDAKPKSCVLPNAKSKHKPVEYRLRWVPTQNSGVGHLHFTFFCVNFIRVGSCFSVEYGLYTLVTCWARSRMW